MDSIVNRLRKIGQLNGRLPASGKLLNEAAYIIDTITTENARLQQDNDGIAQAFRDHGFEWPGWIEHSDENEKLIRDPLTPWATVSFTLGHLKAENARLLAQVGELRGVLSGMVEATDNLRPKSEYSTHDELQARNIQYTKAMDAARRILATIRSTAKE